MIDMQMALRCSRLSDWAYGDLQQFKDNLIKHGYILKSLKFFSRGGAQAYGMETKTGEIVIVFRGTEPTQLSDIIADLKAWPSFSETRGKVHGGFKDELNKIEDLILEWMPSKKDKTVICTGHSLGAAMASIFAARLHSRDIDAKLYTFGSPRVGDKIWAKKFENIDAYRFVNNNDIVCRVPTDFYYEHVGEVHYFSYSGKVMINVGAWARFKDRIKSRLRCVAKLELFDALYDHNMSKYTARVDENK